MKKHEKIYIAGHRGLVGSAILRRLLTDGFSNIVVRTHDELDLTDQQATEKFFASEKPDVVFLAAAKVGGILANQEFPVEFIRDNINIQTNVIGAAYQHGVRRLLFLGSSCIYPKLAAQPIREESLLTGPLEPSNRPYAIAKIAGIEMCWSYNRQYGTQYLSVMPSNLYGPGDNYHLTHSHVIPALIRKFHTAKQTGAAEVLVWGTGRARREFVFSDDMADACVYLMRLPSERFAELLGHTTRENATEIAHPPIVNIGVGSDMTISELAEAIQHTTGYQGRIRYDATKPDGTPQKLLDTSILSSLGWTPKTPLTDGLRASYADFLQQQTRS
ncbi:GDP-L-fucose synthase family protein [Rhodocyclus gracilis]|uniref:GDP-L-fucose synthase n=1 Tax=Rhodocyclus tenuis TaxID=1066 RepID=A0A6L5JW63_RHOTE|nr:GDP-L-fucose synthase [Rhodocyclus gracilis]MQY51032.1 NAD-dependent epimerase/dehydratase family protein [Rhodocyclus gracilis]